MQNGLSSRIPIVALLNGKVRWSAVSMYLYEGLGALRLVAADSESVGDSRQLGQRPGSHFSHDVAAMDLYRDLADT